MKKQLTIVGMIFILLTVGFSGCNKQSDEDKLIGTWIWSITIEDKTVSATYTFFSDKTFKLVGSYDGEEQTINGVWKIEDNNLVIVSSEGETTSGEYTFSNNNKTLTLIDHSSGLNISLIKQ